MVVENPSPLKTWAGSRRQTPDMNEQRAFAKLVFASMEAADVTGINRTPGATLGPAPVPIAAAGSAIVASVQRRGIQALMTAHPAVHASVGALPHAWGHHVGGSACMDESHTDDLWVGVRVNRCSVVGQSRYRKRSVYKGCVACA